MRIDFIYKNRLRIYYILMVISAFSTIYFGIKLKNVFLGFLLPMTIYIISLYKSMIFYKEEDTKIVK